MSEAISILLVADRAETAGAWTQALEARGLTCKVTHSAREAERCWDQGNAHIAIVDLYGDDDDLQACCRALRTHAANPVLVLCDGKDEATLLACYEAGADEVLLRPVSPLLLLAKVTAWLRHTTAIPMSNLESIEREGLRLEPWRRILVLPGGDTVRLTPLETRLLALLMARPRRVYSAEVLLERVWGQDNGDSTQIKNVVYRLRRKIEPDPRKPCYLCTTPGQGYSFRQP